MDPIILAAIIGVGGAIIGAAAAIIGMLLSNAQSNRILQNQNDQLKWEKRFEQLIQEKANLKKDKEHLLNLHAEINSDKNPTPSNFFPFLEIAINPDLDPLMKNLKIRKPPDSNTDRKEILADVRTVYSFLHIREREIDDEIKSMTDSKVSEH